MNTFSKTEILCNKKLISELYSNGDSYSDDLFRIVFCKSFSETNLLKIQINVPKRNITSAVKRNRIKRQIKEAIRKNKYFLIENLKNKGVSLNCAILYQVSILNSSEIIEEKIISLFDRLIKKI